MGPKPTFLTFPPEGLTEEEIELGQAYWDAGGPMTPEEWEDVFCSGPEPKYAAPYYTRDVEAAQVLAEQYRAGQVGRWRLPEPAR